MKTKIINKKVIKDLLKETAKKWDTYVPQKKLGDDIWFEPLPKSDEAISESLDNLVLGDQDMVISPKDIFFPQVESMLEFNNGSINETVEYSPKLLFGVKSCDLKGILFVDEFYKRNYEDIYYLSRVKDRFIVVIGCIKPPRPDNCFCSSADTGPFSEKGFDLQLVDAGEEYIVEIGSEEGEKFIDSFSSFFQDSTIEHERNIEEIKVKASKAIKVKVDFKKALELMADDNFVPEENYKRIGERCIYCGGCLYVCPTCTCFNVFDNTKDGKGVRFRNWDGCVFSGYTREASGHNPREEKWIRTSRRYEHKLKYDNKITGKSGCVGCGRCLSSCPVNIGMSKFIQEITEKRKEM